MLVNKEWLEAKVKELNEWLQAYEKGNHLQYAEKLHNRNYYVNKIIEMDESGLEKIKI